MGTAVRHLAVVVACALAGAAILYVHQLLARPGLPCDGEYFFSRLISNNYTAYSAVALVAAGVVVGWAFTPLTMVGAGFVLVQPIALIYELVRYPYSHTLLPADMALLLLYALPPLLGVWLGKRFRRWRDRAATLREQVSEESR